MNLLASYCSLYTSVNQWAWRFLLMRVCIYRSQINYSFYSKAPAEASHRCSQKQTSLSVMCTRSADNQSRVGLEIFSFTWLVIDLILSASDVHICSDVDCVKCWNFSCWGPITLSFSEKSTEDFWWWLFSTYWLHSFFFVQILICHDPTRGVKKNVTRQ